MPGCIIGGIMFNSKSASTVILLVITIMAWGLAGCQAPAQPAQPAVQPPAPSSPPAATNPPVQQPAATPATATAWAADGVISPGEYQSNKSFGDYELNWNADDQYIYVGMKARTPGWVAVGFDPESLMLHADIVMGYVQDGKLSTADMYSTGQFGPHPPDTQQGGTDDILASGGKTDSGYTSIEFKRKLDTGDKYDKPIHKGLNNVIWAYGSDPQFTIKHMARGSGQIDIQ
jgi:hypothetical protein